MVDPTTVIATAAAKKVVDKSIDLLYEQSGYPLLGFGKLKAKPISYRSYMMEWKDYIISNSHGDKIISNAWAFASREGFYEYEKNILEKMPDLYKTISDAERQICEKLVADSDEKKGVAGFVLYGYGNAYREDLVVKEFLSCSNNIDKKKFHIIMYDCSPVYHGLALSHFNPLKVTLSEKNVNAYLLDIEGNDMHKNLIKKQRSNAFKKGKPVVHLFMGNYASNVEEEDFKKLLEDYTLPGDYILFDHAVYGASFFLDTNSDYTCVLAKKAVSEIFSIHESDIETTIIIKDQNKKFVKIEYEYNGDKIIFNSMLRRNFDSTVIYRDTFHEIERSTDTCNGVKYILYKRT